MLTSKPVIAITMGDPCGIGPEITVRSIKDEDVCNACIPIVIGDKAALERAARLCHLSLDIISVNEIKSINELPPGTILLKEMSFLKSDEMIYGKPVTASGKAVFNYIAEAAELCLSGNVSAMVTAPINKSALNMAGYNYPGHTELLAELTQTGDFVMMLAGESLRVSLVTIHEPLAAVPELITYDRVLSSIIVTDRDVHRYFKRNPRIAVLSLNPHAGEGGMFGDQETRIIGPAIKTARHRGIDASGPHSADTLFHFAARGEYDAVVCMYHDQGLIPLKLLHFDDGVNITLGLPIIRTSVDHGTAYNLAGMGTASYKSMKAAILTAASMAGFTSEQ